MSHALPKTVFGFAKRVIKSGTAVSDCENTSQVIILSVTQFEPVEPVNNKII